jgi:hypothetical protein
MLVKDELVCMLPAFTNEYEFILYLRSGLPNFNLPVIKEFSENIQHKALNTEVKSNSSFLNLTRLWQDEMKS